MKEDGLKRTFSQQVFCQMEERRHKYFGRRFIRIRAFSSESFFTNLYGQALEKFLTRNHGIHRFPKIADRGRAKLLPLLGSPVGRISVIGDPQNGLRSNA